MLSRSATALRSKLTQRPDPQPHFGFWRKPNIWSIYTLNGPSLLNLYWILLKFQLFNYTEFWPRETVMGAVCGHSEIRWLDQQGISFCV